MKKITLLFVSLAFSLTSFSQGEAFVKTMKKLEYGSTILDAAMMMKTENPQFENLYGEGSGPVQVTVFTNPYDEAQKFKIEALYFVNREDQQLIQLYYVNDGLYQKAIYWFLPADSVTLTQTNYKKAQNTFVSNPVLLQIEGGKVKGVETSEELGKRTDYLVEKQGKNERSGRAGYELVYQDGVGARGFWVYMQAYNTMKSGLDMSMNIPFITPPAGTFDELQELLSPVESVEE